MDAQDGLVQIIDVATYKVVALVKSSGGYVLTVRFSPRGKSVAYGVGDGGVYR